MDTAAAKKRCEADGPHVQSGVHCRGCLRVWPCTAFFLSAALEALEEAQAFRTELEELVDGDDSTLADQIRDLMLNLDEGILRGSKEGGRMSGYTRKPLTPSRQKACQRAGEPNPSLLTEGQKDWREALEFYANEENYPRFWLRIRGGADEMVNLIARDCGERARAILRGSKEEE